MHPLIMRELVDGHIRELHGEARVARLAKASKQNQSKQADAAPKHRVVWFRRLVAGFAVSLVAVLALASTAVAMPVRASSRDQGHIHHSGNVPTCVAKVMPRDGLCRHPGTGAIVSIGASGPSQVTPVQEPSGIDVDNGFAPWATVGLVVLAAGATLALGHRRRVATV
jgi:hypothetical protein